MDVNEIRAKYWKARQKLGGTDTTIDRELAILQFEMLTEVAAQLAEMNAVLKRVGIVNFEKLALQLDEVLKEKS